MELELDKFRRKAAKDFQLTNKSALHSSVDRVDTFCDYLTCGWWTRESKATFVLDPDTKFIRIWSVILLFFVLVSGVTIPFRIAFGFINTEFGPSFAMDYIGDLIFIIDIFLNFRLGFYYRGQKVMDAKLIARRYTRSYFTLDLLASLPLDFLQFIDSVGVNPWVRVLKLLRMFRFLRLTAHVEKLPNINVLTVKLLKLTTYIFLVSHYAACGFYSIQDFGSNWGLAVAVADRPVMNQYLASFHWAFGLISGGADGGIPSVNAEYLYTFAVFGAGVLVFAYIVGSIGSVVDTAHEKFDVSSFFFFFFFFFWF